MKQRKLNRSQKAVRAAFPTAILSLSLTVLLSAGVYGRYSTAITTEAAFTLQPKATVQLFSARDAEGEGDAWLRWVSVTPDVPTEETPDVPTDVPTEDTTDEPTEDAPDAPPEDTPDEPTEDTPDAPTEDTTDEPTEDTTDVPTEDTTDVPTEDTTDAPTEDATYGTVQVTADGARAVSANEKTQTMSVCISNSDMFGGNTIEEDVAVRLRLYLKATPELADDQPDPQGNMIFTLQVEGETVEYRANCQYLSSGSALYREKGAGWIYSFEDALGNELTHLLKGGAQSDVNVTLAVYEFTKEISGFELLVDQQFTAR